jgi:alkylation response protein AidB-like acyl-CoA dehydrogenase
MTAEAWRGGGDDVLRLTPDVEQVEFGRFVTKFLAERCDETEVRRLMEDDLGYDPGVWSQASAQLGLAGLDVPEEYGGSGAGFREMAVVMEALGGSLGCLPFYATSVLAVGALLAADDEQARAEYLPGIAAGTTIATVAAAETGTSSASEVHTSGARVGSGFVLNGSTCFVVDGCAADLLLVFAQSPVGLSLFAVSGDAPGLTRTAMPTLDPTRKVARLTLDRAPGRLIGPEGSAPAVLDRLRDRAALALACEQLGVASRALSMAVAYAKTRMQFGRPIGSFQAVKHRCVDMAQQIEAARSATQWAVAALAENSENGENPENVGIATALASVCSTEAAVFATAENVQVHGGIGFTWEHPAHLYFRRARSSALLHGSADDARELLLRRLGV